MEPILAADSNPVGPDTCSFPARAWDARPRHEFQLNAQSLYRVVLSLADPRVFESLRVFEAAALTRPSVQQLHEIKQGQALQISAGSCSSTSSSLSIDCFRGSKAEVQSTLKSPPKKVKTSQIEQRGAEKERSGPGPPPPGQRRAVEHRHGHRQPETGIRRVNAVPGSAPLQSGPDCAITDTASLQNAQHSTHTHTSPPEKSLSFTWRMHSSHWTSSPCARRPLSRNHPLRALFRKSTQAATLGKGAGVLVQELNDLSEAVQAALDALSAAWWDRLRRKRERERGGGSVRMKITSRAHLLLLWAPSLQHTSRRTGTRLTLIRDGTLLQPLASAFGQLASPKKQGQATQTGICPLP